MASGSYAKPKPRKPIDTQTRSAIPARATRQLPALETLSEDITDEEVIEEEVIEEEVAEKEKTTEANIFQSRLTKATRTGRLTETIIVPPPPKVGKVIDEFAPRPLTRHKTWLNPVILCLVTGAVFVGVLLSASMAQRPGNAQLVDYTGGKVYSIQVGGNIPVTSWQANKPVPAKTAIPTQTGPYSVLGKPTITAAFINQVLASYNSPAVGKGQALYDMGVQYGIDPAFALAFFLHESTLGTMGEARSSLSLGNLRCYNGVKCQDNYAWYNSWDDGFQAWYELIRNVYVAQWGLTTVDKIIPTYAPNADNNNEAGYIAALKHYLDTWRAGVLRP